MLWNCVCSARDMSWLRDDALEVLARCRLVHEVSCRQIQIQIHYNSDFPPLYTFPRPTHGLPLQHSFKAPYLV